jgi:hypothetical protein
VVFSDFCKRGTSSLSVRGRGHEEGCQKEGTQEGSKEARDKGCGEESRAEEKQCEEQVLSQGPEAREVNWRDQGCLRRSGYSPEGLRNMTRSKKPAKKVAKSKAKKKTKPKKAKTAYFHKGFTIKTHTTSVLPGAPMPPSPKEPEP